MYIYGEVNTYVGCIQRGVLDQGDSWALQIKLSSVRQGESSGEKGFY